MILKPGTRVHSTSCNTEIVVVRARDSEVNLRCGGTSMSSATSKERLGEPKEAFASGTLLGKRYETSDSTLELLCVQGGAGTLSIGEVPLQQKGPRKLPASD